MTNTNPFVNIPDYPAREELEEQIRALPRHVALDADSAAASLGSKKASNMVVLGAAAPFIGIPFPGFEEGIRKIFGRKGEEIVDLNLAALRKGKEMAGSL